jgi:uncharacterized protein YrrD
MDLIHLLLIKEDRMLHPNSVIINNHIVFLCTDMIMMMVGLGV